jgi:hypothetical protein
MRNRRACKPASRPAAFLAGLIQINAGSASVADPDGETVLPTAPHREERNAA